MPYPKQRPIFKEWVPPEKLNEMDSMELGNYKLKENEWKAAIKEWEIEKAPIDEKSIEIASALRLYLDDGPLLQTKSERLTIDLWNSLRAHYETRGFSSEFLIIKEFFATSLANCNNQMESYLYKIKRLTDELYARNIPLPHKVIVGYVLSNLGPEWDSTVAIISQSYRNMSDYEMNMVDLFGQLVDEANRRKSLIQTSESAMIATKPKPKPKKCSHCYKKNHTADKCFIKHPELKRTNPRANQQPTKTQNDHSRHAQKEQAYITNESTSEHCLSAISSPTIWHLDSGATSHISGYKDLF